MGKQLPDVSCKYGAPMGRHNLIPFKFDPAPRTVRLFAVRLDSGGYDDGGAYWGVSSSRFERLYCLTNGDDYREFIRAPSRFAALAYSGLAMSALVSPATDDGRYTVSREWYGTAKPGYVARFCGDWLGVADDADEAWAKCADHWLDKFGRQA